MSNRLCLVYGLYAEGSDLPFYVGVTWNPSRRLVRHLSDARCFVGENEHKERKIRKLLDSGIAVDMRILGEFDTAGAALELEANLIRQLGDALTNHTTGGEHPELSDLARQKISATHKDVPKSREHRDRISEAHKGKVFSEETIRRMSDSQKRRYQDAEQRRLTSIATSAGQLGRKMTEETRAKISVANKQNWAKGEYREEMGDKLRASWTEERKAQQSERMTGSHNGLGTKRSVETRLRMSEAQRTRWSNPAAREKMIAAAKRRWQNPEYRERQSESQRSAWQARKQRP